MNFNRSNRSILLALAALLVASLACNFPATRQEDPPTPIPVSTEAVENLEATLGAAAQEAQAGQPVTVQVTETQLTSLVALELQSQSDPILQNPQVYLRDGQIELHGDVNQSGLTLPLKMDLTVTVNEQGKPQYEVASANLGPFPLPQSVLDQIEAQMDQALSGYMTSETDKMVIENITIADGTMTITGHTR